MVDSDGGPVLDPATLGQVSQDETAGAANVHCSHSKEDGDEGAGGKAEAEGAECAEGDCQCEWR